MMIDHRLIRVALLVAVAAALLVAPTVSVRTAAAQDPAGDALRDAARSLWDDDSPANRERVRTAMLQTAAGNVDAVVAALAAGPEFKSDVTTGASTFNFRGRTGEVQVSGRYVPSTYDPGRKYPMIVWLHGSATGDRPDRGAAQVDIWKAFCEKTGTILVAPSAYAGAAWWEINGAFNVLRSMKLTKGIYNVDENRTFIAGFSDGGSGVYWFLDHFGTYFAGGISFSGHPSVAGAEQAYGQFSYTKLAQRPLLVCQGGKDRLYPASRIQPFIDDMKQAGVPLTQKIYEGVGHSASIIGEAIADVEAFINSNVRDPKRTRIQMQWDGTPALNRVDWLKIDSVRNALSGEPDLKDPNTYIGKASLGCDFDETADGTGLKVSRVTDGSAAAIAGVMVGDWIRKFNTDEITSATQLDQIVQATEPGSLSHMWVWRNNELVEIIVEFPPARVAFPRERPMSGVDAVVDGNTVRIKARGVDKLSVMLPAGMFNQSEKIKVVVNGTVVHDAVVKVDAGFAVSSAASDRDRGLVYTNQIQVTVPRTSGSDW